MLKRYDVDLTHQERGELLGLLNIGIGFKGVAPARTLTRARILLAADKYKTDAAIAEALNVHPATVEQTGGVSRRAAPLSRFSISGPPEKRVTISSGETRDC